MIERERIIDPQEVERAKSQLPKAELALRNVRERIEKSPRGYYSLRVSLPEGSTEWRIDDDVTRMIGGGILSMYNILHDADRQSEEKQLDPKEQV